MTSDALTFRVVGRVQGVWFRASTVEFATSVQLTGWVRNCEDGSVEGHAEGTGAALDELVTFLRHGPINANVVECHIYAASVVGYDTFVIQK